MRRIRWLRAGGVALLWVVAFAVGNHGIDFGHHWDEWYYTRTLERSVKNATLVPGEYTYNSLYFEVGYALLVPQALGCLPGIASDIEAKPTRPLAVNDGVKYPHLDACRKALVATIKSDDFLWRSRNVYLALTCLAIVAVYLLVRRLAPGEPLAAFAAACVVALSFEVGTQARYVAVDGPMLACIAFAYVAAARAVQHPGVSTTALVGAFAGLAVGWKLPAVVAVALVILVVAFAENVDRRRRVAMLAAGAGAFAAAFIVTTPGAVLDPLRFLGAQLHTKQWYVTAPFAAYLTEPPVHVVRLMHWWLVAVPSSFPPLSVVLAALGVAGAVRALRDRDVRRPFLVVAIFSALWFTFLVSASPMVVHNALPLVPLLAASIGLGASLSLRAARRYGRAPMFVVAVALATAAVAQLAAVVAAARTMSTTTAASIRRDAASWLTSHVDRPLYVSPFVRDAFTPLPSFAAVWRSDGTVSDGDVVVDDARVAVRFDDHMHDWPANRPGFLEAVFGSREASYDYYPTWFGRWRHERIHVLSAANAKAMKIDVAKLIACARVMTPSGTRSDP